MTAGRRPTGFLDGSVTVDGVEYPYQVYVPRAYRDGGRPWPVVLFLHGSGERGRDGLAPTAVGLGPAIRSAPERWPALVVFPQAPEGASWVGAPGRGALAALDRTLEGFDADPARVGLVGLSMGGCGAWHLAAHHPHRFSSLVVVCGFVEGLAEFPSALSSGRRPYAAVARAVSGLSVWIVHGDADRAVPVAQSRRMHAALVRAGADVTYREFPGVGHGSWEPGLADPALTKWFFGDRAE